MELRETPLFRFSSGNFFHHFPLSQLTANPEKIKIQNKSPFLTFFKKNFMTCKTKKRKLLKHEFSKLQINTFLPRFPSTHFLFLPEFAWETKLCAPRECLRKSIFWFKIDLIIDKYRYL